MHGNGQLIQINKLGTVLHTGINMQCIDLLVTTLSSPSSVCPRSESLILSCLVFVPSFCKMEGSKVVAMAVCALLVLSWAGDVQGQCSINQLNQCMSAVTRGTKPSPQCCRQVGAIADFNCFCKMMQSQRNIPQSYIYNAVRVPGKCGVQGQKLRNRQCGNVRIP